MNHALRLARVSLTLTALLVLVGAALAAGANAAPPPAYYPSGPQANVAKSSLSAWTLCFSSPYANTTPMATVLAQCNHEYLLLGGGDASSSTLSLLAAAPRADVLFDAGTTNTPHNANGSGWYFNDDYSWGFAPQGDAVRRAECDNLAGPLRLCWQTNHVPGDPMFPLGGLNPGWRLGDTQDLFGDTAHTRYIYDAGDVAGSGPPPPPPPPPPGPTPGVSGSAVNGVTATGATISADVNPNGVATTYRVEYGLTTSYGSSTLWTDAGVGSTATGVSVPLTGLAAGSSFHVRLAAQNTNGTTDGPDLTFTTLAGPPPPPPPALAPSVSAATVGTITAISAKISGSVNPNGAATSYRVEYGTSAAYGSATAWVSGGAGSAAVSVTASLVGLASSASLHARLIAQSVNGTTLGPDVTFTTLAAQTPPAGTPGGETPIGGGGAPAVIPPPVPSSAAPLPGALPATMASTPPPPGSGKIVCKRRRCRVSVRGGAWTAGLDGSAKWALTRGTKTVARGLVSVRGRAAVSVSMRPPKRLRRGSYDLTLSGYAGGDHHAVVSHAKVEVA